MTHRTNLITLNTWDPSPRLPFSINRTNHVGTCAMLGDMLSSALLTP